MGQRLVRLLKEMKDENKEDMNANRKADREDRKAEEKPTESTCKTDYPGC
jgi:hypothetical protein